MSDELEEVIDNIRDGSYWKRILFMIAFAIAGYIILMPLIFVLSIAQALFTLITGQVNANLRYFSATLALYVTQVVEFLTYLSEVKPYPFSDFPEVEDDSTAKSAKKQQSKKANGAAKGEAKASATSTVEKKSAATKKTVVKSKAVKKKKVAKKKAAKKAPKTSEKSEADALSEDAGEP